MVAERLRQAGAVPPEADASRGRYAASDTKNAQFGVREVTYEVSLFDTEGPAAGGSYPDGRSSAEAKTSVDVTHEGIRQIPDGWAPRSTDGGRDASPAVHAA